MPRDPIRLADAKAWLAKADMNLKAAAHELTAAPPFTADAVFHAQQAAEKAMKGFLAWHDVPFRKTHDLAEIGHQCAGLDPSLELLLMRAASLTQYAWKFRYPGEPEEPLREEAEISIALAREVYEAIVSLLPQEFDLT
jgi:HEPN domain-containing protein